MNSEQFSSENSMTYHHLEKYTYYFCNWKVSNKVILNTLICLTDVRVCVNVFV